VRRLSSCDFDIVSDIKEVGWVNGDADKVNSNDVEVESCSFTICSAPQSTSATNRTLQRNECEITPLTNTDTWGYQLANNPGLTFHD
jgi:hypothetical protein